MPPTLLTLTLPEPVEELCLEVSTTTGGELVEEMGDVGVAEEVVVCPFAFGMGRYTPVETI